MTNTTDTRRRFLIDRLNGKKAPTGAFFRWIKPKIKIAAERADTTPPASRVPARAS
jgi:hypothetical protein